MADINIRRCTVAELEAVPDAAKWVSDYGNESAHAELGPPNPQTEIYRTMERSGILFPIGAFDGERLAGFILPVVVVTPHYGTLTVIVESFFVPAAERKRGIGLMLKDAAEALGREKGAKAIIISAPIDSRLEHVLGASYRPITTQFVKALA